jgi:hypothetical protein
MKWTFFVPLFLLFISTGCNNLRQRETAVQQREEALAQKEQVLLAKENQLELKAQELLKQEQQLKNAQQPDSSAQSLVSEFNPALVGNWNARMICTETTCTGSAVGDTKTEAWEITYQSDRVVAKAMTGENMFRIYTGTFRNNLLELTENVDLAPGAPATQMVVRLTLLNQTTMEGQREIIRTGDCRIVYDLQLNKQ